MRRDGARGPRSAPAAPADRGAAAGGSTRPRVVFAAVVVAFVATACGGGSAPDQLLEKVASWASSARLAAENRASGATSARYTRNVLHATHAEVQQNLKALHTALYASKDSSQLAPELRAQAIAAASAVERTVGDMARAADEQPDDVAWLLDAGSRADEAGSRAKALAESAKQQQP
jgi:hypothetical protein